jgi:hypothetical protein
MHDVVSLGRQAVMTNYNKNSNIMSTKNFLNMRPRECRTAQKTFAIPKDVKKAFLPSAHLTFKEMTQHPLSNPNHFGKSSPCLDTFFSSEEPTLTSLDAAERIWKVPLPPSSVVRQLQSFSWEAWMKGRQSVLLSHLSENNVSTERLPLWTITSWEWVLTHRIMIWVP